MILGAIGVDDLFVGPSLIVGKENGFAEHSPAEARERLGIDAIVQALLSGRMARLMAARRRY
jgi:hypothetical protein